MAEFGPLNWTPVGGGFSGSSVWRGDDSRGPALAIKKWPASMSFERLAGIHVWMKQAAALPFVPRILNADHGGTVCIEEGRVWDLTTWMPGNRAPETSPARSASTACSALAELHQSWRPGVPRHAPIPAVQRRIAILNGRVPNSLAHFVEPAKAALAPWLQLPLPIQPCLCDVHRDHILFEGDRVAGIIDYGAMKEDHVAVDLARYLGDVCGEDDAAFESGLASYGNLDVPSSFVRALERTGLVCALIGWELRWGGDSTPDRIAVQRVEQLRARAARLRGI